MLTPYQFASNSPIANIDLDGLEKFYAADGSYQGKYGESTEIRIIDNNQVDEFQMNISNQYVIRPDYFHDLGVTAYSSSDQAALDWSFRNNGKTHKNNVEYAAKIYTKKANDGTNLFVLGKTVEGGKDDAGYYVDLYMSFNPFHEDNWATDSGVHTHPPDYDNADPENFSPYRGPDGISKGDKALAWNYPNGLYLATPKGLLKHFKAKFGEPGGGVEREVYNNLPSHQPWGVGLKFRSEIGSLPSFEIDKNGKPAEIIQYDTPQLDSN